MCGGGGGGGEFSEIYGLRKWREMHLKQVVKNDQVQ